MTFRRNLYQIIIGFYELKSGATYATVKPDQTLNCVKTRTDGLMICIQHNLFTPMFNVTISLT